MPECAAKKYSGKQDVHGKSRAARHERHKQRGERLVPWIFQGPGCVDARDVAAETQEHRNERFAVQADGVHGPVHDEGSPRHVAASLQEGDEKHHGKDDRDEDQDETDPGDDAVVHQRHRPVGSADTAHDNLGPMLERTVGHGIEPVGKRVRRGRR